MAGFPLVLAVHSFGALLGFLAPPRAFQTTEKAIRSGGRTAREGDAKAGASRPRRDDGDP